MSAQVDAEQTALAGVVYQHEGEFGAWVDCSEAVFNFWQRSGTLKSRKLYTSAQQPAAGTYPEQWRLDDRELNAGRLKALHRGLELARKWSAGTGTHGHTDRMVRDMADELRSALSSQDGDYAHQTAPVVDDARMARALEWARDVAQGMPASAAKAHLPAIEEAIAAYDPNCGARTVRVVDDADATEILALSLDEFGYHTEAKNVRAGEDLDEYRIEMWAIRAALARAQGVQS